jgi:hypothetical protein
MPTIFFDKRYTLSDKMFHFRVDLIKRPTEDSTFDRLCYSALTNKFFVHGVVLLMKDTCGETPGAKYRRNIAM